MISYFSYYLILSAAVGIFQIIEGVKLFRKEGKVDENDLAMSVIEFIWFLVSCAFVVYLPKELILLIATWPGSRWAGRSSSRWLSNCTAPHSPWA